MKGIPGLGCATFLLRFLLVSLLLLSTIWTLATTFLVNLNSRPVAMALVAEAGAEFLTPAVTNQQIVTVGYQDVEKQAATASAGASARVYFPFVRVPLQANEVAGKSLNAVLGVVYTHVAAAYYDTSDLGNLFGLTPPQEQQYGPYLKQVCAQVAAATAAGAVLPPGADLASVLNTLFGQSGSGTGSGTVTPEQAKAELSAMQQLCASVQSGKALTLNDFMSMLNTVNAASATASGQGGTSGSGAIPQLPNLSSNPTLNFFGLSSPLSTKAESQTTNLQRWGLGVSALLALLLVLLSRGFGRLAWPAVGVLLGSGAVLGAIEGAVVVWSRNMGLFQPHAALLHLVGDQVLPPTVIAVVAGGLGVVGSIVGTIVTKAMAAHAGATAAAGAGLGQAPALVPASGRSPLDSFTAQWGNPSSGRQVGAGVQTTLPVEPAGAPPAAPAPRAQSELPPIQPSTDPDGPTFDGD